MTTKKNSMRYALLAAALMQVFPVIAAAAATVEWKVKPGAGSRRLESDDQPATPASAKVAIPL